jgi:uncharacterized protein YjiS (DUF1127 family)
MLLATLIKKINAWTRYRRNVTELSRLTDRELADIGIQRHDVPRLAWDAAQS